MELDLGVVRSRIARSQEIYTRGESIYLLGNYTLRSEDAARGEYTYAIDGTYGDYVVTVALRGDTVQTRCTCPYPHAGCKHIVAACLDVAHRRARARAAQTEEPEDAEHRMQTAYLTPEEIRALALEGRKERSRKEAMKLLPGETYKGAHTVRTGRGAVYTVTIYTPAERSGHCTCADYATNHLETCKHLMFAYRELEKQDDFRAQTDREVFPFVHLTWSSRLQAPVCHYERIDDPDLKASMESLFNEKGVYTKTNISHLYRLYHNSNGGEALRLDEYLLGRIEDILYQKEVTRIERGFEPDYTFLKANLYPYQRDGIRFAVFRRAAIIADEMGLGKTIQAIAAAILKKSLFGFRKVLVVSPSSLKDQWRREIGRFTTETAIVVEGGRKRRQQIYGSDQAFFKITNYEAVLRDVLAIQRWSPDLIILDEAQRIKNFDTKTHQALMSLPKAHVLVITGTPLENRLEDLYSIVQFCDRTLLTPLWVFAANHMNMSADGRTRVMGYRNLEVVHDKLKGLILRRTKEQVFESLPDQIENNYYLDLTKEQAEIHQGYVSALLAIVNKKVITPLDMKRIQGILVGMRMVCDSTFLIDRETNISPKLVELASILKEIVIVGERKALIFTEWTTMAYLIGKVLSELGIDFVEFSGKVPATKRPLLIERFQTDPACRVFLSTDAGGVGLNLQNADCVINFELPWNPARLNQRIGRVNRLGQKSRKINVVNLVCKSSIEERVLAGINLKQELFDAVLDGGSDEIDFSQERKNRLINQVRALLDEEPLVAPRPASDSPDLDETTPHYLNPEILAQPAAQLDVAAEEPGDEPPEEPDASREPETVPQGAAAPNPDQIETVLNQGLVFLNTLSQMATGRALVAEGEKKSIEIDRATGEVVLRFKLPGF